MGPIFLKSSDKEILMNDVNMGMFWIGLFLAAVGAGTSDAGTSRYSFPIGIVIASVGMLLIFFSFKQNRNPKLLRRKILVLKQDLLSF